MTVTEHIGKLAYLLRVEDGLIEGNAEIVRAENCEVGVGGFEIFVGMSVYDRKIVVVVLLTYKSAGVLAEGTNLVLDRKSVV